MPTYEYECKKYLINPYEHALNAAVLFVESSVPAAALF
jgi:hypothetical protein